jgi:DoxX-like family
MRSPTWRPTAARRDADLLKSAAVRCREVEQRAPNSARSAPLGVVRGLLYEAWLPSRRRRDMDANAAVVERQQAHPTKKSILWAGRVLSAVPILMLLMSAAMKLAHQPMIVATLGSHLGFRESTITGIGLLELACVALYAVPATSVFGVVMLTAYLGGAVAAHVRVGDPFPMPIILATLAWLGLYLRDQRLRALLPLRAR